MRVLMAAASMLAACATTATPVKPELPAWVARGSGRCPDLPESGVLPDNECGIGVATNAPSAERGRIVAEAKARGELAAVLRSRQKSIGRAPSPLIEADAQQSRVALEELINRTAVAGTVPLTLHDEQASAFYACVMVDLVTLKQMIGEIANTPSLSEGARAMFLLRAGELADEWSRRMERLPAEP